MQKSKEMTAGAATFNKNNEKRARELTHSERIIRHEHAS